MKTILVDAVHTFVIKKDDSFQIFKEMQELLEKFPNKKIILTNANDEEYKKFSLDKMPWEVFTLKHNPEKTNPEYYKTMFQKFNLDPKDVIYFEHSIDAVKSAQLAGITTYHYNNEKKDLTTLKKFIEENL
jgi:HAD superfamily hydrolase (TIGR01509 family)